MTCDSRLSAMRALIVEDIGGRGLARVVGDNLLTHCADDYFQACVEIGSHPAPTVAILTGFFIPTADLPANETDGPLGAVWLARALRSLGIPTFLECESSCANALTIGLAEAGLSPADVPLILLPDPTGPHRVQLTHRIALERVGPSRADGRPRSMRGRDLTDVTLPTEYLFADTGSVRTIGIGDGGNEIGMGKIPWPTIRANIANGEAIACRVATDHLIVAGISNWGAYALGTGIAVVRNARLPLDLFDPETEEKILRAMVTHGPLVDGVSGSQAPTVDGIDFRRYARVLEELRRFGGMEL